MLRKLTTPDLDLARQAREAAGAVQFADLARIDESLIRASDHLNRQVDQVLKDAQAASSRLISSTTSDLSRAMQVAARDAFPVIPEISKLYSERLATASTSVQRLVSAADIFRSLDQVVDRVSETADFSKWIRTQIGVADLASTRSVFTALADRLTAIAQQYRVDTPVEQSFVSRLVDQFYAVTVAEDEDNLEQAVGQIEALVEEEWERLPESSLSRSAFRQVIRAIIVALLFFLLGRFDDQQMESRMLRRVDRLEQSISTQIEGVDQKIEVVEKQIDGVEEQIEGIAEQREDHQPYYVVTKSVPLRGGPSKQHEIVDRLAPNTVVEVVDQRGNWLSVEYFDFGAAEMRQGWVFKRFLIPLRSVSGSTP